MEKDIKKDLAEARLNADNRMREIDYQVDTLSNNTSIGGYFMSNDNSITINYVKGNENFNAFSESMSTLIHEQKHRDNNTQGMFEYALSPEQAYKIDMHNEISANMAALIYLRDRYLKTGDISVFDKQGSRFSFYTDAIKKGEINPSSNKKEDFDKEMALIANGTRDMWMRRFSARYIEQSLRKAKCYGEKDGKHAAYYDQNYERARKIAYTIGGVDFTQYMDKDVEIPYEGKREVMGNEKLTEELDLPKYDGKMSLLQYQNLLQHAMVAQDPKCGIKNRDPFPGSEETHGQFNMDMAAYVYLTDKKLTSFQQEQYQDALDRVAKDDKALIDGLVNQVARDYAERGEKLPEGNDKAYQKAVDELYTGKVKFNQEDLKFEGKVNLRQAFNPKDDLPLKELPQEAAALQKQVEDMGRWKRGMTQYAHFFGENWSGEKFSNLPEVVRYPMEAWVVGVGAPVAAGIKKCSKWGSDAVDTVKGWFSKDTDQNKPVHPVDKDKKPRYREWSPKHRVSDVQKKEVINLMEDVIRKPQEAGIPDDLSAIKWETIAPSLSLKDNTQIGGDKEKNQGLKEKIQKDKRNADNKYQRQMVAMIQNMNKTGSSQSSVDAQKTTDVLCQKYGDNAYNLLVKAITEPTNYSQITGDSDIKTSRAAVQHLSAMENNEKTQMIINKLLQSRGR